MEQILDKFKSANELARAYAELETAFTKKSMELAALREAVRRRDAGDGAEAPSRTVRNPPAAEALPPDGTEENGTAAAREQFAPEAAAARPQSKEEAKTPAPPAAADTRSGEADGEETESMRDEEVARFFGAYPAAREDARALAELLAAERVIDYTAMLAAYTTLLSRRVRRPEDWADDEDFLARYVYPSARIRDHFYDTFASEPAAPKLMRGGAGALIPPARPATLADAAELARRML